MTSSLLRRLVSADRRAAAHLRRRVDLSGRHRTGARRSGENRSGDAGFALLETVIAISLIVLVMAAFSVFFINTVAYTSLQRATQAATTIANSQLELVRAQPASDLIRGRTAAAVTAQLSAAPTAVAGALAGMTIGTGAAFEVVPTTTTPTVPTAATLRTLNNITFSTTVYLGNCTVGATVALNLSCVPSVAATGYLRAVVAVTWAGSRCPSTGCTYITSTLVSTAVDPTFSPQPNPPPAPALTNPGNQTSAVGDVVTLPVTVSAVAPFRVNVTTGTLPAGLFMDTATGIITGSPVTVASATTLTLTLTDGFGRAAVQTFTWTVIAALSAGVPVAQAGVIGAAVAQLTVTATGGTAPYTWADAGTTLPPGLTLASTSDTAVITGTPTTFGTYPVTLRVTDAAGRISTTTFTWSIDYPPFAAANPGPQTSTVGVVDTVPLSVTGGSGSVAWTGGETLPAGMALTPAGVLTGTPTTAGTKNVTLIATDTKTNIARTVPFTFTVFARPTVTAPGNQQSTVGAAVSLQVGANCPNSPCSFVLNNGPATLGISATGLITGTITSGAQTFGAVTFTMTDSAGAAVTSSSFSWVVVGGVPSAPQNVTVVNGDSAVAVSWTAPASGSAVTGYTVTLTSVTAGQGGGTCTTTGALTCTVTGLTNGVVYTATVTATTSSGVGPASTAVRAIPYPAVMTVANGLSLWLDGTDSAVFTTLSGCTGAAATTTIGCWKDKSGLGQNFLQTTTANQPVVSTWNGLPAANFTDTGDVLNSINATGSYQTVFTAANILNSGNSALWVDVFGQANTDYNVRLGTNGERAAPNNNDWAFNTSVNNVPQNWINGAQGVKGSPPAPTITSDQAASVKTFAASVSNTVYGRGLIGQIGDVITFNRVLTTAERRSVEEYLGRKWGVAITPQAPTAVTVSASTTAATVSWTAPVYNGGSAVTGYKVTASANGTTVAATCPTSGTTTATTCAVSGLSRSTSYTFSVVATNASGTGPGGTVTGRTS